MESTLYKKIDTFERVTSHFLNKLGKIFAFFSLMTLLLSCLVVFLRYIANYGSIALQELIIYSHAVTFLFCMSYTLDQDRHIRVDIFYRRFSDKVRAYINLIGTIIFLWPLLILITYTSWGYVTLAWQIQEGSPDAGGLPYVYLLKSSILGMVFLLMMQSLVELIRNYKIIISHQEVKDTR